MLIDTTAKTYKPRYPPVGMARPSTSYHPRHPIIHTCALAHCHRRHNQVPSPGTDTSNMSSSVPNAVRVIGQRRTTIASHFTPGHDQPCHENPTLLVPRYKKEDFHSLLPPNPNLTTALAQDLLVARTSLEKKRSLCMRLYDMHWHASTCFDMP